MHARLVKTLLAATLVGSLLGACGDDDGGTVREEGATGSPSGTASATGTGPGSATGTADEPPIQLGGSVEFHGVAELGGDSLEMEADDFYFGPTFVKVSGGTATIELDNHGDVQHTFTIEDQDIDVVLDPGQKDEVEVELPDSGHLEFICRFHEAQGMKGAFYVEA